MLGTTKNLHERAMTAELTTETMRRQKPQKRIFQSTRLKRNIMKHPLQGKEQDAPMVMRSVALVYLTLILQISLEAQENPRRIQTVHVNLSYAEGLSGEDARHVADYLQSDYEYLSQKLGMIVAPPIEVVLYDSRPVFLAATRQPRISKGVVFSRNVLHVELGTLLGKEDLLEQSLSFELAMLMLDSAGARGCPRWLRESFGVYHSGEMTVLSAPQGPTPKYFSDLDQDIQQYPNPPQRDDLHYRLGMTMRFFMERFGEEKVYSLFRTFSGKESSEEVFKNTLGEDFEDIERAWAGFLASDARDVWRK
jgi:hypothetical protein